MFALLNLLIERCGEALKPLVMQLAGALPHLWERAEGQSLLRIQVRSALRHCGRHGAAQQSTFGFWQLPL